MNKLLLAKVYTILPTASLDILICYVMSLDYTCRLNTAHRVSCPCYGPPVGGGWRGGGALWRSRMQRLWGRCFFCAQAAVFLLHRATGKQIHNVKLCSNSVGPITLVELICFFFTENVEESCHF